jgi:predicted DNA-binding transcriptional regulator YafY
VLPSRLRRRVSALQAYTVPVPRDDAGPTVDTEILTALAAVCRDRERLRFDYADHSGAATVRAVESYRLVSWGRRWYLFAWDLDRDDWRTFRVDRMRPRIPTGPRFAPRELPDDVAAYVSSRVSAAAWRYRVRVTVHAPAEVVGERISPAAGVVERVDEHTCVLDTGADAVETLGAHLRRLTARYARSTPPADR